MNATRSHFKPNNQYSVLTTLNEKVVIAKIAFLSDPGIPGVRSMGPKLSKYKRFCRLN